MVPVKEYSVLLSLTVEHKKLFDNKNQSIDTASNTNHQTEICLNIFQCNFTLLYMDSFYSSFNNKNIRFKEIFFEVFCIEA